MQTIKLRQTTENNGGPFTSKSDAKGVSYLEHQKATPSGPDQATICENWEWEWVK